MMRRGIFRGSNGYHKRKKIPKRHAPVSVYERATERLDHRVSPFWVEDQRPRYKKPERPWGSEWGMGIDWPGGWIPSNWKKLNPLRRRRLPPRDRWGRFRKRRRR